MRPLINSLSCQTFSRKVSWEWRLFDACILVLYTFKNDSEPFHLNAAGGWFCYRVRFKTNALALLGVSTAFISTKFAWRLDASPRIFASFRCANFRTDSGGYKLQSLLWLADPAGDWSHEKRLHRTVSWLFKSKKTWRKRSLAGGWTWVVFGKQSPAIWKTRTFVAQNCGILCVLRSFALFDPHPNPNFNGSMPPDPLAHCTCWTSSGDRRKIFFIGNLRRRSFVVQAKFLA